MTKGVLGSRIGGQGSHIFHSPSLSIYIDSNYCIGTVITTKSKNNDTTIIRYTRIPPFQLWRPLDVSFSKRRRTSAWHRRWMWTTWTLERTGRLDGLGDSHRWPSTSIYSRLCLFKEFFSVQMHWRVLFSFLNIGMIEHAYPVRLQGRRCIFQVLQLVLFEFCIPP